MRSYGFLAATAVMLAAAPAVAAQDRSAPRTIGLGDPVRAALLETLRTAIARDLEQPVRFVVREMRTQQGWAFVSVRPQTPAGAPIDFARTRYAEQQAEGMLDGDTVTALLREIRGKWSVVTFVIGPTDVAWADWPERFGAPAGLILDAR